MSLATRLLSAISIVVAQLTVAPSLEAQSDPDYLITFTSGDVILGESIVVDLTLTNNGEDILAVQGGVCHDPDALELVEAEFGPDGDALDRTFWAVTQQGDDGYTWTFTMNVITMAVVSTGTTLDSVVRATYVAVGDNAVAGSTTTLENCETLGNPIVENRVILAGTGDDLIPDYEPGTISFLPEPNFIRGDCDDDSLVALADGLEMLGELFQGDAQGMCAAACDANNDDAYTITDPIYLFTFLFLDGPAPPIQYPDCGIRQEGADDCWVQASCE